MMDGPQDETPDQRTARLRRVIEEQMQEADTHRDRVQQQREELEAARLRLTELEEAQTAAYDDFDDPMPRRPTTQVSQVPAMNWTGLPTLDFNDQDTVYPYMRVFETIVLAQNCDANLKLVHFLGLPNSVTGCVDAITDDMRAIRDRTYKKCRNNILVTHGPLSPVVYLIMKLSQKRANCKSTAEWVLRTKETWSELRIAAEAHNLTDQKQIEIDLLTVVCDAYSGQTRHRLHSRLKAKKDVKTLYTDMLTNLPPWETDHVMTAATCAAAPAYKASNKSRYNKRGGTGNNSSNQNNNLKQRNGATSYNGNNRRDISKPTVNNFKRVDRPFKQEATNCRYCGATPPCQRGTCPASNQECTKCGRKGHFTAVCRATTALIKI